LDVLKKEVHDAGLDSSLVLYIQKKETDVENAKKELKIKHLNKIINEYKTDTEIMSNIILKASEVIQEDYLLLRSLKHLDQETLGNYKELMKMLQGQRSVKFDNDIECRLYDTNDDMTNPDYAEEAHLHSPSSNSQFNKRHADKASNDELSTKKTKQDYEFVRSVLKTTATSNSGSSSQNMNSTFNMNPQATNIFAERTNKEARPLIRSEY
jgi:spore coat polysaccharide biosynthesis protein SpsF (cytidylyltransferase family)